MWRLFAEWGQRHMEHVRFYKRTSDICEVIKWLQYDGAGYDSHFSIPPLNFKITVKIKEIK